MTKELNFTEQDLAITANAIEYALNQGLGVKNKENLIKDINDSCFIEGNPSGEELKAVLIRKLNDIHNYFIENT